MRYYKIITILFSFLLLTVSAFTTNNCKYCGYRIEKNLKRCPQCLRKIKWPLTPPRAFQARVVVREGEDAFIRNPYSQNKYWLANRNAGADTYGPIGSWGDPTALRYLIHFKILQAFKNAHIDISNFNVTRARLILRVGHNTRTDNIPLIIFPLLRPFTEGYGKLSERYYPPTGCTWFLSSPNIEWAREGGEYRRDIFSTGMLSSDSQNNVIDITSIVRFRINQYHKTNIWENPGMIIMRNPSVYSKCKYLNIYSFDSGKEKNVSHVISPELYIE